MILETGNAKTLSRVALAKSQVFIPKLRLRVTAQDASSASTCAPQKSSPAKVSACYLANARDVTSEGTKARSNHLRARQNAG